MLTASSIGAVPHSAGVLHMKEVHKTVSHPVDDLHRYYCASNNMLPAYNSRQAALKNVSRARKVIVKCQLRAKLILMSLHVKSRLCVLLRCLVCVKLMCPSCGRVGRTMKVVLVRCCARAGSLVDVCFVLVSYHHLPPRTSSSHDAI